MQMMMPLEFFLNWPVFRSASRSAHNMRNFAGLLLVSVKTRLSRRCCILEFSLGKFQRGSPAEAANHRTHFDPLVSAVVLSALKDRRESIFHVVFSIFVDA
jgi:hypothetical protein